MALSLSERSRSVESREWISIENLFHVVPGTYFALNGLGEVCEKELMPGAGLVTAIWAQGMPKALFCINGEPVAVPKERPL